MAWTVALRSPGSRLAEASVLSVIEWVAAGSSPVDDKSYMIFREASELQ